MAPSTPLQTPVRAACACLVVTLAVSACHDSPTDPMASLTTEATSPALRLEGALPSIPDLAAREGVEDRAADAVSAWVLSWEDPGEEGARMRSAATGEAVPVLAPALGRPGVTRAVDEVGSALEATRALDGADVPRELADRLARARGLHADAVAALGRGDDAGALASALGAADALREVGPRGVALTLLVRAEDALATAAGAGVAEEDLERGERLVHGARQAVRDEDWSRAIQRAYYASQLLDPGVEG